MLELTTITGALGGLKTASDLLRAVRDGVKSKQLKLDEVDGRISEAYDHIVDAKVALSDAKDEISRLQAELAKIKDFEENYELRDNVRYRKGTDDAYCPVCMGATEKAVPLYHNGIAWYCTIHDKYFQPRSQQDDYPGCETLQRRIRGTGRGFNTRG